MKPLKMAVFGITFGVASPIPGLDGGTFFILFNVYEDFINSAKLSAVKEKWRSWLPFLIGCALGLFGVSNLMLFLLRNHELIMYYSFVGLIIGCIPMIYKKSAFNRANADFSAVNIAIFAIALAVMIFLAYIADRSGGDTNLYAYSTAVSLAWIFFAAAISALGLLIPGVGGALLMLVLGIYTVYIEALAGFDFIVLITLAAGMVFGILSGLRLVRKILRVYPTRLYCAILGFTIGSVYVVIPGFSANVEGALAILFCALFVVVAYKLSNHRG